MKKVLYHGQYDSISILVILVKAKNSSQALSQMSLYHCIKYRNSPILLVLKFGGNATELGQSALNSAETGHFQKISNLGN